MIHPDLYFMDHMFVAMISPTPPLLGHPGHFPVVPSTLVVLLETGDAKYWNSG